MNNEIVAVCQCVEEKYDEVLTKTHHSDIGTYSGRWRLRLRSCGVHQMTDYVIGSNCIVADGLCVCSVCNIWTSIRLLWWHKYERKLKWQTIITKHFSDNVFIVFVLAVVGNTRTNNMYYVWFWLCEQARCDIILEISVAKWLSFQK